MGNAVGHHEETSAPPFQNLVRRRPTFFSPRPDEQLAWGSRSMTSTDSSYAASAAARFMTVVVLPTPPFWLVTATTSDSARLLLGVSRETWVPHEHGTLLGAEHRAD